MRIVASGPPPLKTAGSSLSRYMWNTINQSWPPPWKSLAYTLPTIYYQPLQASRWARGGIQEMSSSSNHMSNPRLTRSSCRCFVLNFGKLYKSSLSFYTIFWYLSKLPRMVHSGHSLRGLTIPHPACSRQLEHWQWQFFEPPSQPSAALPIHLSEVVLVASLATWKINEIMQTMQTCNQMHVSMY